MSSLLPHADRLASLEQRCQRMESHLAASRRHTAERNRHGVLWVARTVEPDLPTTTTSGGGGETTTTTSGGGGAATRAYPEPPPPGEENQPHWLPIVTLELDDDTEDTEDRWGTAKTELAYCPFGWLPPGVRVWVTHDRRRYVVCQAPEELLGVPVEPGLAGVTCTDSGEGYDPCAVGGCRQFTLGAGDVHIWQRKTVSSADDPIYEPQYYRDDEPVLMPWQNVAGPVRGARLQRARRNAYNDWLVVVEPYQEYLAELVEDLPRRTDDEGGQPVLAVLRTLWSPDYWGTCAGEWVVDRRSAGGEYDPEGEWDQDGAYNPDDEIYVLDGGLEGVQYCGPAGSKIVAARNPAHLYPDHAGKPCLYLVDMQCPPGTEPDCGLEEPTTTTTGGGGATTTTTSGGG